MVTNFAVILSIELYKNICIYYSDWLFVFYCIWYQLDASVVF